MHWTFLNYIILHAVADCTSTLHGSKLVDPLMSRYDWSPGTRGTNNHAVVILLKRLCSPPQPESFHVFSKSNVLSVVRMNITWWRAKRECKQLCQYVWSQKSLCVQMLFSLSRWVWVLRGDYTGWGGSFHTLSHNMMNNSHCFHQLLFSASPHTLESQRSRASRCLTGSERLSEVISSPFISFLGG